MERLIGYFEPENYDLDLNIDRSQKKLSGSVEILGQVLAERVKFHAEGFRDLRVLVDIGADSAGAIESERSYRAVDFDYNNHEIVVNLTTSEIKQNALIRIDFERDLKEDLEGCYLSNFDYQGEKRWIATTQFESHYARKAFPCIDEPEAKATFDLNLEASDLREDEVVLANTELLQRDGWKFHFATTPRMSTYLLAWVIGPLQKVVAINAHGVQVATYGTLAQPLDALEFANETAMRALEYYDDHFGVKYPLNKLDQVALPDFEAGAMENWGLVTYRETMMLAPKNAALDTKKSVALTVTHELSHQWFGDLVTMKWWDELWLNESFASVMEYYATDALYPEFNIWEDFFTGMALAALRRDSLLGVQAVQQEVNNPAEIATLFDGAIVYAKGARLILMLIRAMGFDKFTLGLKDYFERHAYQNTVGDDLWAALQPYADFDVKNFMHAWISQPGYPVLSGVGFVDQKRFLIAGEEKVESLKNSVVKTDANTSATTWPIPEVKDDLSGHYLLNLSSEEFAQKLAVFPTLSLEQKLRILIDRTLLAKTPAVESASLLDLLPQFAHETSAPVWGILATIISDIKLFCPPFSEERKKYRKFLRETFREAISQISLEQLTESNEIDLRNYLLGVATFARDTEIMQRLGSLYQDNLAALDSELRTGIIGAKIYANEAEVFANLTQKYQQETDPELKSDILYCLATNCRDEAHLEEILGWLNQPEIVRPQDHLYLYLYLLRNPYTTKKALNWLTKNWEYVQELAGDKSIEDYPRYTVGVINTLELAEQFWQFFADKKSEPALARALEIAETEITSRLALIAADSSVVAEKLAKY